MAQWDKSVGSSCPSQALFALHKQRDYSEKGLCPTNKQGHHTHTLTHTLTFMQESHTHIHTSVGGYNAHTNKDKLMQTCLRKHNMSTIKRHTQLTRSIITLWRHLSPLQQLMSSQLPGCYNEVAISRGNEKGES